MALTIFAGLYMCFLTTIILASVHTNDQEEDGDFSSGSGNGTIMPCTAGDTTSSNFTSSKDSPSSVTLIAQCYSLCVNEYSVAKEYDRSMLSSTELRANCSFYNQVYLCQEGCELSDISEMCSSDCYESCEIHKLYLPDSLCTISCLSDVCEKGCQLYKMLRENITEDMIPVISDDNFSLLPFSSPYLHAPGAYLFLYNVSSFQEYFADTLVSFILQVIPVSDIETPTAYYWLSSNDDVFIIDSYFLCKEVKIRFVLVNEFGRGNFSKSTSLTVYGNVYPELPDHPSLHLIQWTVEDDDRMEHWEQAIVNISWQQPHNVRYATGYLIMIEPLFQYCGCSRQIRINDSSVLFATWEGGDSPLNNCTYDLKIISLPYKPEYGLPDSFIIEISTKGTNTVPKDYLVDLLFVGSQRLTFDSDHYQIYSFMFSWSLPTPPLLTKGIFGFNLYFTRPSNDSKSFLFIHNNSSSNFSIGFSDVHSSNEGLFLFELETVYYKNAPEVFRYIKRNFTASFDARPFPPPPPAYITIKDISFNNNGTLILFIVSWAAVPLSSGRRSITNDTEFYVHIGLEALTNEPATSLPQNGTVYWTNTSSLPLYSSYSFDSVNKVFILMIFDDATIEGALPLQSDSWTLFVQVARVKVPSRRPGKWSYPSIFKVSNNIHVRSTTTINPVTTRILTTSNLPSVTAVVIISPDYNSFYYSITIMFFVLLLLAVSVFGTTYVYRRQRRNLDYLQRVFFDK